MKKTINYEWPVSLTDFSQDTTIENFSRGKLKVFFNGETADHRYFSKTFSENLVKTLPYTPVVSYYDEEEDDFVGHATEQQILGIVDPCREISFETDENGVEWCVCDVVLYTERPDKVGAIAKKIVGHKQSLELDPKSTKYVINYDEKKHFKNIEFTAGRFVGVSVLGNDQKPAFTGSEFFSCNETFESKMKILKDYCERKQDQSQHGGEEMNLQEFMKLSWGDISLKVEEQLNKEYQDEAYVNIIDMFDDCVVARFYYYLEGVQRLMRVSYEFDSDNGDIKLGRINEVRIVYEDVEVVPTSTKVETDIERVEPVVTPQEESSEVHPTQEGETIVHTDEDGTIEIKIMVNEHTDATDAGSSEDAESNDSKEEEETEEVDKCECDSDEEKEKTECDLSTEEEEINLTEQNPAQDENVEIAPDNEKVSVDNEQNIEETNSSTTSFTESERAELEALKREKKITLVNSYKEQISNEDYDNFVNNIDSFDEIKLELELLKSYKKQQETSSTKPMRAFAFAPVNNAKMTSDTLDSFVRKNLR